MRTSQMVGLMVIGGVLTGCGQNPSGSTASSSQSGSTASSSQDVTGRWRFDRSGLQKEIDAAKGRLGEQQREQARRDMLEAQKAAMSTGGFEVGTPVISTIPGHLHLAEARADAYDGTYDLAPDGTFVLTSSKGEPITGKWKYTGDLLDLSGNQGMQLQLRFSKPTGELLFENGIPGVKLVRVSP